MVSLSRRSVRISKYRATKTGKPIWEIKSAIAFSSMALAESRAEVKLIPNLIPQPLVAERGVKRAKLPIWNGLLSRTGLEVGRDGIL